MIATVVGVALVVIGEVVKLAAGSSIGATSYIGAALIYVAVALWVAYGIVRMVTAKAAR